jgi:hypothetical protein
MQYYTVKVTDRLLRFDTTGDSWTVTLLPFAQTPNAPYEVQKTSQGDGNTVTVQTDLTNGPNDFLLADGSTAITLDDTTHTVYIRIPANGASPAYVNSGGQGGGAGVSIPSAPPVTINPPAEVLLRDNGKVEIDVAWTPNASANASNFSGVKVFVEDPDISSGTQAPLDGTTPLDGSAQVSGAWQPSPAGNSTKSPASVVLDEQAAAREVRIYLAAYGPNTQEKLVRANQPNPTPNITAPVPSKTNGQVGMEYAFLVTDPKVTVVIDYDRPDPNFYLTFAYTPPDPATPIPANLQPFAGCRIIFVPVDAQGNPQFGSTVKGVSDTGLFVPSQWAAGFKQPVYNPAAPVAGNSFRCYFCSQDTLGDINSLVEGVTPYDTAVIPPLTPASDVCNFLITNPETVWLADGSFVNQATFSWSLPGSAQCSSSAPAQYAGVILYLVDVTGTAPLSKFPQPLTAQEPNIEVGLVAQIPNGMGAIIPANDETWTIAAISVNPQGSPSDDPAKYGVSGATPPFHSPTVQWTVGPPQPGSAGSGQEYAPLVTINSGATVTTTETNSADGVRMVSFAVGSWTNPTDPQFGGARIAMIVNHDVNHPIFWDLPNGATSFTTPAIPTMGTVGGLPVAVNFYIVSHDPQGHENDLIQGTTPEIPYNYSPKAGAIIPARTGWFDPNQFAWDTSGQFQGQAFSASIIQVGKTLVVGGGPVSFSGQDNGQIAVMGVMPGDATQTVQTIGWIGMQQPVQGKGAPLYGAWFKQLWVGGNDPLTAPLWIDTQGIIEVGGIAAQQGAKYPYLSIRDQTGLEMGRIGAQISVNSGSPGDNTGGNPPQLTAGAWFTQLAVGGSSLTNWNILIAPSPTNPLGSNFQMRNIALLTIDYPYNSAPAGYFNNEYRVDIGNSVWMAAGLAQGTWVFPGLHIYEVDNVSNNFGATFISRGMVLRGTQNQQYEVLVSLVSYNGNPTGQDSPKFYGELTMYCPGFSSATNSFPLTIDLAAGSTASDNPYFTMFDKNGNRKFWVDIDGNTFQVAGALQGINGAPIEANQYAIYGYTNPSGNNLVIDSGGHWVGQPIASGGGGSQSPWTGEIAGAGHALTGAGEIQATQFNILSSNLGDTVVINTYGQFVGQGVITSWGVGCSGITCTANALSPSNNGNISCVALNASSDITSATGFDIASSLFNAQVINNKGIYVGFGVDTGTGGVKCPLLNCTGDATVTGKLNANGGVYGTVAGNVTGTVSGTVTGNVSGTVTGTVTGSVNSSSVISCLGLQTGSSGVECNLLTVTSSNDTAINCNANGGVNCNKVTCNQLWMNNSPQALIGNDNIYIGAVSTAGAVVASGFGIKGGSNGTSGSFTTANGKTVTVTGGIITSIA